jgi:hypothetical protein
LSTRVRSIREAEKGREGAGGYHVGPADVAGDHPFETRLVDGYLDAGEAGDMPEEAALPRVAFHESHGNPCFHPREGDDEAGEPGPRPQVEPTARAWLDGEKLKGIRDVPVPNIPKRGRSNEVLDGLPPVKLGNEEIEPLRCFT